jgi:hypothetical protein
MSTTRYGAVSLSLLALTVMQLSLFRAIYFKQHHVTLALASKWRKAAHQTAANLLCYDQLFDNVNDIVAANSVMASAVLDNLVWYVNVAPKLAGTAFLDCSPRLFNLVIKKQVATIPSSSYLYQYLASRAKDNKAIDRSMSLRELPSLVLKAVKARLRQQARLQPAIFGDTPWELIGTPVLRDFDGLYHAACVNMLLQQVWIMDVSGSPLWNATIPAEKYHHDRTWTLRSTIYARERSSLP